VPASWDRVCQDFPTLQLRTSRRRRVVYLDSACQSLRPIQVIRSMERYYSALGACGNSGPASNFLARKTTEACAKAREKMARFLRCRASEVVWQPNTTHALNTVIRGLTKKSCPLPLRLTRGDEILTTDLEHHSNLLPLWMAHEEAGIRIRVVQVTAEGLFDLNSFQERLGPRTKLVSILWSSNMTGTTFPLKEISRIAHDNGTKVLADGAQFVPHHPVNVHDIGTDFLAFSVHKMCGPAGMGVLYGREELLDQLPASVVGGETVRGVRLQVGRRGVARILPVFESPPERFEAGLQNFSGIIGTGAAVDYLSQRVGMSRIEDREAILRERLLNGLRSIPEVRVIGPVDPDVPGRAALATFLLPQKKGEPRRVQALAQWMDSRVPGHRIMLRSSGHEVHPFHYRLGLARAESSRVSPYFYNTPEEIDLFLASLKAFLDHDRAGS
jgi:cysteine desulfurase/selenocysteine lyase